MHVRSSYYNFCFHIITAPEIPDILPMETDLDCESFQKLNVGLEFLNKFLRKQAFLKISAMG